MGVRHFLVPLFALCSLIIPSAHKVAAQVPYGSCFASRSTWFADNQHGACMYGPSLGATGNGNYLIAASSMLVFDNSADCGACYQITGPNGTSVIVTVVDQCTDGGVCNTNFPHLDLSPQAFDTLADPNVAGVVNTNVQRVACPVQGGIKLRVGSNFFSPTSWEILIFNHRLPITQVTVLSAGQTTPVSLPRQTYNYWRYDGPAITYPVVITVTDILGNVASFNPTTFSSGLITESAQQFSEPYPYPGSSEEGCPAPPPVAVSTGGWIYQNGLTKEYTDTDVSYINTFQWTDWSYGTTVNWASTTNPFPGSTTCAQAALASPGAIQIGQVTSFPWAPYFVALQFAIRADSAYSGISVGWKGSSLVPVSVTTSWQLITLSLGPQLQTPAQIGGQVSLLFQNMLGQTSPNIYLDNIRLIPIAGSSSSSSSSTAVSSSSSSVATTSTTSTTSSSSSSSVASSSSSSSSASTATTSSTSSSSSSSSASSSSSSVSSSSSSSSTSSSSSSSISTTSSSPSSGGSSGVVPSNPLPSPQCSISITQAITGSWSDSTTQYTQWSVSVVNTSPQTITEIGLVPQNSQASEIVQFWCVNLVQGTYSFPSWESALSSGSTFTWGYISIGSEPVSFTVVNTVCS